MANEQYAFLDGDRIPSREQWQEAIAALEFDLQLDPTLDPRSSSGYVPCTLAGEAAGFELSFESEIDEDLQDVAQGKQACFTFRWGGSMRECACVLIASSALAAKFGAVVSYGGEDPDELDVMLDEARELVRRHG